jgi:hypothetical protein
VYLIAFDTKTLMIYFILSGSPWIISGVSLANYRLNSIDFKLA